MQRRRQANVAKLLIDDGVYRFHRLKLCWLTGQKFVKVLHDVARSSQMNLFKSEVECQSDESAHFTDFDPKLVAMATSLKRSEKGDQVGKLRSNTYHMLEN